MSNTSASGGSATGRGGVEGGGGNSNCCSFSCKKSGAHYALVTGASDGIGHKIACGLCKNNFHVFLTARDQTQADAAATDLRNCGSMKEHSECCICPMELNVLKEESIKHAAEHLKSNTVQLDALICNAGVATRSTQVTLKSARECIDVNFYGYWKTFECMRSHGLLKDGCHIIFVDSNLGVMSIEKSSKDVRDRLLDPSLTVEGLSNMAEQFIKCVEHGEEAVKSHGFAVFESVETMWDYAFSKALVLMLTRILAKKYEGKYIINAIHPGYVQTAMTHFSKEAHYTAEEGAKPIVDLVLAKHTRTGLFYEREHQRLDLLNANADNIKCNTQETGKHQTSCK